MAVNIQKTACDAVKSSKNFPTFRRNILPFPTRLFKSEYTGGKHFIFLEYLDHENM
jgi:hypothetical protein